MPNRVSLPSPGRRTSRLLIEEGGQELQRIRCMVTGSRRNGLCATIARDLLRGIEGEPAGKDRQAAEEQPFRLGQQA